MYSESPQRKDTPMPSQHTRVSIIGCGHVGTSCAYALLQTRLVREIILIGDTPNHVQGEAMDLQQAVPLGSPITVVAGTYKDAAASSIVDNCSSNSGMSGPRVAK